MDLASQIEAILFYKNEPVPVKELEKFLSKTEGEIGEGIEALKENLKNRGLTLVEDGDKICLATSSDVAEVIGRITKEELSGELGKASLETLSIILYNHPISRREIDYVRGVNSNFILRSLLVRGLIEKVEESKGRAFSYKPTVELLAHLGVESADKLPEIERIKEEIRLIMETPEK